MEWNYKFLTIYPLPALLTPLLLIPFTTEEITGCTNEAAKGANKAPRNPLSFFVFCSCFTVLATPSINTPESSNDFIILIILFICSFDKKYSKFFSSSDSSFSTYFLVKLFIALEVKFLTNPGKLSLAKGIAILFSAFLPKLNNEEPKDLPDCIILDI